MTGHSLKPVGEWLGESFGQLRGRWVTLSALFVFGFFALLLAVVTVYGLGFAFFGFIQGWDNVMRVITDPRKVQYLLEESRGVITLLNLLVAFVALRVYCWVLLAAIHASLDASLGVRAALKKGKGRGYAFLVLFVVQQAVLQIGVMLLILPGIILAVWLGFALWAFARNGAGVFQSLGDSARAVKGHFFGVLGRMLLAGLVGGAMMIVPLVGWLVGAAWIFLAWGHLYTDLRGLSMPEKRSVRPSPVVRPVTA
jgi:hypothetical protein